MDLSGQDLDELLTWTLIRAAHAAERRLTTLFADHDLAPAQFGLLAHLATGRGFTSAELARAVLIRPQSIAAMVDGLAARGLVSRTGGRAKGHRNPIELSSAGHSLLARVWPEVLAANRPEALGLDEQTAAELNRSLHTMLSQAVGKANTGQTTGSTESGGAAARPS